MRNRTNSIIGYTFGWLRADAPVVIDGTKNTYFACTCQRCGNKAFVRRDHLVNGMILSCGCYLRSRHKTKYHRPTRRSWRAMWDRVTNPNNCNYHNYGGRGIRIYPPWMSFDEFVKDMGERPAGTSIDRIDNDGHYYPDNCRWATSKEQRQNQRTR